MYDNKICKQLQFIQEHVICNYLVLYILKTEFVPFKIWFTNLHAMFLVGWFQEATDKQYSSGRIFSDEK